MSASKEYPVVLNGTLLLSVKTEKVVRTCSCPPPHRLVSAYVKPPADPYCEIHGDPEAIKWVKAAKWWTGA